MTFMRRVIVSLILCCTLGFTAFAQGVRNTKETQGKQKHIAVLTPNQQSALLMLDQLFEAAKGFDDIVLRIRTQARVADMLWTYDEPRAAAV
jgi:23S rRNA A2030 N6-methylase RlmJ